MRVLPLMEQARHHHVTEHMTRLADGMLGNPSLRHWTDLQPDFNSRADFFNPSGLFIDRGILPRRGKAGERVRCGMEAVDMFCGGGHAAAVNEGLAHDINPAFQREPWDFRMFLRVWRGKKPLFAQERRSVFTEAL